MLYNQPFGVSDPNAPYINGNVAAGIKGSIPPASSIEYPQREIVNLEKCAGFVPSNSDLSQVARSVRQGINYLVAAQAAGPNVLSASNPSLPLDQYRAGLRLNVLIPADNTDLVTLSVDGLGFLPVVRGNGSQCAAGDLRGGMVAGLVCDGSRFQIENYQGFTSSTTNNNTYVVNIPFCHDSSSTVNIVIAPFSPAITALKDGDMIEVKLANTFTGPSTITVNALTSHAIVKGDGTATGLNDAVAGEILVMVFDQASSAFQIVNRITSAVGSGASPTGNGCCYLSLISGNLVLMPKNGSTIAINNALYKIPATGIALGAVGLASNVLNYIYAFMSGSVMQLEGSQTGHVTSAISGVEIKNGDETRTLVGAAYVLPGPVFADTDGQRLVLSWFNRMRKPSITRLSATVTTYSSTWLEISSSLRNYFITWANERVYMNSFGSYGPSMTSQAASGIAFDGNIQPDYTDGGIVSMANFNENSASWDMRIVAGINTLTEGFHTATLKGLTTGSAACSWWGADSPPDASNRRAGGIVIDING